MFMHSSADVGQPKETNMTLYLQDRSTGPNATVVPITGIPGQLWSSSNFGTVLCSDDPITEGLDENSAQIGRAQGIFVTSSLDGSIAHVSASIVFTNGPYNGSTIEIQGVSRQLDSVSEVAVVAGTGIFRYARGYATFEMVYLDSNTSYSVIRSQFIAEFRHCLPMDLSSATATKLSLLFFLVIFICSTSEAEVPQLIETKMSLYFQDYATGPNATAITVTGIPGRVWSYSSFGTIFVTDDPITESINKNSPEIARGQGIYVTSSLDGANTLVLLSIVFTNREYNGSTLEIQGRSVQLASVRELLVVSGTEKFRFARGFAT
ncbi:hypothetical protein F0562_008278 [Nyssa sinensis]|uniref:Dirigent protein n=1 Tax=Nyssa sinensis TaxID=561372 RepID=A0A5J5A894_9ASTE|nr:hypothetical protein F0562_008278 [Nyssa sinensis]